MKLHVLIVCSSVFGQHILKSNDQRGMTFGGHTWDPNRKKPVHFGDPITFSLALTLAQTSTKLVTKYLTWLVTDKNVIEENYWHWRPNNLSYNAITGLPFNFVFTGMFVTPQPGVVNTSVCTFMYSVTMASRQSYALYDLSFFIQ